MAGVPRKFDLVDRLISLERRIKRLEIANPPKATENFILDPVTVRAMPPAPAPPRAQIRSVSVRLGSGGPIDVDMNVRLVDGTIHTLWTFNAVPGDGTITLHDFDVASMYDLEQGEAFFPEITDAPAADADDAAHDLTASFVMGP